jgi:RNA polymerase sigma factor (sigma-70 family)
VPASPYGHAPNVSARPAYWLKMPPMESNAGLEALLGQAHWLRALAVSLLGSRHDADDAVQEVWRAALRSPPDEARPARPWLAQVLRNVIRSGARHAGRRRAHEAQLAAVGGAAEAPAADGVLERMQLHRRVAELVMALEEPYRTTLLLRFYEGRPAVELARAAGVPEGTIRWRVSEGVRRLRQRLDEDHGGARARWAGLLAPLVGLPAPAPASAAASGAPVPPAAARMPAPAVASRVPFWLGATLSAGALGLGVVWVVGAHLRPGGDLHGAGPGGDLISLFHHETTSGPKRPESEDASMKRERLKQAARLFGVVLPLLGAGASQAAEDQKLEEAVIAACLELHEKIYECREAFADATIDLRAAHGRKPVPPQERARVREKQIKEAVEMKAAPMERKRALCQHMMSRVGPLGREGVERHQTTLRSCYTKADCKERVACIMPVLAEVHGADVKKPPPKR